MRPGPRTAAGCLLVLALARAAAANAEYEPIPRIAAAARAAAGLATGRPASELEVATIDPRLRLPECESQPAGHPAPGTRSAAQLTIEVRCPAPSWREYVSVRVREQESVVIAARPLSRLQPVTADDVEVVPRELAGLPAGYFRHAEDVLGRLPERNIGAGEVLDPRLVHSPPIIHRGQSVTVIVRAGGLSVRTSGIALADAGQDERVRVRNVSSARLLEGVARTADTVEVAVE